MTNALRGFPLAGCKLTVPKTHEGVIFQESHRSLGEDVDRNFKIKAVFNEFTYWNYDKIPSKEDKLNQALQWNEFADAVSLIGLNDMLAIVESNINCEFSDYSCMNRSRLRSSMLHLQTPKRTNQHDAHDSFPTNIRHENRRKPMKQRFYFCICPSWN